MKTNVLIYVFLCLSLVSKGQTYNPFVNANAKKHQIKSILVKFYFDKVKSDRNALNYQEYFDKFGYLVKRVYFFDSQKKAKTTEILYSYTFEDKKSVRESIMLGKEKEVRDSSVFIIKNDSTLEQKEYRKGKLIFYGQSTMDASKRIKKKIQIIYHHEENLQLYAYLRHSSQTKVDTSIVTKISYLDSTKAHVKEYFNNNKKNYSEGFIYYNQYKNIERKDITDVRPNIEGSYESVELYIYDSKQNLTKIYRLPKKDFLALQENPNAKVSLLDSDTYKYNERNMLVEHTTFNEYKSISHTNKVSIIEALQKLVITYGYEYW